MGDLDLDGKEKQIKEGVPEPAKEPTSVQTERKPGPAPVEQTRSGFQYNRGNFDTSVITLLASINTNIVKQTEILKKAIEENGRSRKQR